MERLFARVTADVWTNLELVFDARRVTGTTLRKYDVGPEFRKLRGAFDAIATFETLWDKRL